MMAIVGVGAVLGMVLGTAGSAFAVINNQITIDPDKDVNIIISPFSSNRLKMKPGDVYDGEFTVASNVRETFEATLQVTPFSTDRETEQKDFSTDTARTQMSKWTTVKLEGCDTNKVEDDMIYFTFRSQEECYVKYHIKVPANAMGGSQNIGIFAQSVVPDDAEGMIKSSYRIGHTVHADIDGPGARFEGNVIYNNVPWLLFNPPLTVDSRVENTGNLDFGVNYHVNMKNYFGGVEVFDKTWSRSVMADSRHTDSASWAEAPVLGLFMVTQQIELLDETSEVSKLVLIVPIWLIVIIVGVILLLLAALILKIRENKKKRTKTVDKM